MNLRHKVSLIAMLTWILPFLAVMLSWIFFKKDIRASWPSLEILLGYSFITSFLAWLLVERLLVKRITRLTKQILLATKDNNFDNVLHIAGKDELSQVAKEMNTLLTTLSEVHKKELNYMVHHDGVTQLNNKVYFNEHMRKIIKKQTYEHSSSAIALIAMTNFYYLRESLSHDSTDLLLQTLTARLKTFLRQSDVIARISGSEFMLYFHDVQTKKQALKLTETMLKTLMEPIMVDEHKVYLKANAGVLLFPQDATTLPALQDNVRLALQASIKHGNYQTVAYSHNLQPTGYNRLTLESHMRDAIKNKEFELYYQPKVNLHTFSIMGAEALIRWNNPTLGAIPPSHFIPLAEETGFIEEIGAWIFQTACQLCQALQEKKIENVSIAVNVSGIQFHDSAFIEKVSHLLETYKFPVHALQVEITESAVVEDVAFAITCLKALSLLGIKISIDDFGTGYASMSYLKNFPLHYLKIDKSFVDDLPNDKNNAAIIEAMIMLGKSLDLMIIAEGVENNAQCNFLKNRGCDIIQGYIFSKPLSQDAFILLLEQFKSGEIHESTYWENKLQ